MWLLTDLRTSAGVTASALARQVPCHPSFISRLESGDRVPQRDFAERCDAVLGTGGRLARAWDEVAWYAEVEHPDWFRRYAEMEAEAVHLRQYQVSLVAGLLQTPAYAEVLFRAHNETADDTQIAEFVAARMSRQHRFLDGPDAPTLSMILDEAAIRREVGGADVMANQLDHLLSVAERPNITLQVAPFTLGERTRSGTMFTLVTLPDGARWIYSESIAGGHFVNDPDQLSRRTQVYDRLSADALSTGESVQLIRHAMEGLTNMSRKPTDLSAAKWSKSSHSDGNGGDCVEAALNLAATGIVPVRDSKNPDGPALVFPTTAWADFVRAAASGEFGAI
ncbi:Scr1 family TA system antitoxin-like transcriptional regulator [Kitasatospora sp. NPDC088346]|uniref:Scr1 family TA system antitoxin-like transcriptional regulator n=1 Tax=Kitasatospora sp. NPDC088346 TaxID=3364073 RepID=UPI00382DA877